MSWLPDNVFDHLRRVVELPDLSDTPYRCIRKVGLGGMGTVYLAEDSKLRRNVALKILNQFDSDGDLTDRMLQEAYVIAALEHPGIVPIHDVGTLADGRIFYTMKYVKGERLDQQLEDASSLPELLRIFQKVCEAVAFAHAHNVVHRDLKPENIMVGDFGEVLVMDWGLSKVLAQNTAQPITGPQHSYHAKTRSAPRRILPIPAPGKSVTEHGTVMGTPMYMAPEQERGETREIDARTDIYALGAILSLMLVRLHCKPGSESSSAGSLWTKVKSRFHKLPKQLQAIAQKAMSERKQDRYENALQIVDDLENYLTGLPVSAYKENVLETLWRWLKQNKFLIFLILVYILVRLLIFFLSNL